MARKEQPIKIVSVEYSYMGTDEDFNQFLKAVIHDYLTKNAESADEKSSEKS